MKTLLTRFAAEEWGAVSTEHVLAIVSICLALVLVIAYISKQPNILFKSVFMAERRRGRSPSDQILARLCAVIDLLVRSGYTEAQAMEVVATQMLAAGTSPSCKGPDVVGCKDLQQWRANLREGIASEAACAEYRLFARQIEKLSPREILENAWWDRRRASFAGL